MQHLPMLGKLGMSETKTHNSCKISRINTCCFSLSGVCLEYGFGVLSFLAKGDRGITEYGHSTEDRDGTISFSSLA